MINEKSLKNFENQFNTQINFLEELKNTLKNIEFRSRDAISNPQINSKGNRKNCIKMIINFRKNLKNIIESNVDSFQILTQLKKEIPTKTFQLKIIEDFPDKLSKSYNQIIIGIFGKDKNELSLNSLLDNRFHSLEEIIKKSEEIRLKIKESQIFIQTFLSNLKENGNKIISLQSEKDNFRVDFNQILKNSGINLQKDSILIFDSNFLIHYLEDQRIEKSENKT